MNKSHAQRLSTCLRLFILLIAGLSIGLAQAGAVTWQDLPWPADQNWGGPQGSPAVTNGSQITLTGQDVLSVQSFSGPLTISYDVYLPSKSTTDGSFEFFFVTVGQNISNLPNPDIELMMNESQSGNDYLTVDKNHGATTLWGNNPFPIAAQTIYHVSINVAANGQVGWSINGNDVGLSNSVVEPYGNFQIRLSSWQPTQVWDVNNLTVVPEPATVLMVGTAGLLGLLALGRRRRSS